MNEEKKFYDSTLDDERKIDKSHWDIRPYLALGLTAVLVFIICVAIFFVVYRYQGLSAGVKVLIHSLEAIIIGFIIAYILNPFLRFFENLISKYIYKKGVKTARSQKVIRIISIFIAYILFFAIIGGLISIIIPQLIESVEDLINNMNNNVAAMMEWTDKLSKGDGMVAQKINEILAEASVKLQEWLQENLSLTNGFIASITKGVYGVVKGILNIVIGLIVSIYVLVNKETFLGQFKKIIYALFPPRGGNVVMDIVNKADEVFGGFFIGKIIDSFIIGCIAFICLKLFKMPYYVLVSVIVGVTNIIPFFGPYIGAIPSAILIFLVNPMKGIYFIIFILVLQQIDGNIIGPKILGDTTGLSPFWVVFSILLFGGSFGIVGMIFGVPIFALIYYIIKRVVEHILARRKLPQQTKDYVDLDHIDLVTNEIKENTEFVRTYIMSRDARKASETDIEETTKE